MNRYPTVRVDYQVSEHHRVTYSMNFQYIGGGPDTTNNRESVLSRLPGAGQPVVDAARHQRLAAVDRSAPTMVNEFRIGYGGAPVIFAQNEFKPEMWSGSVANQGGYYLNFANRWASRPTPEPHECRPRRHDVGA